MGEDLEIKKDGVTEPEVSDLTISDYIGCAKTALEAVQEIDVKILKGEAAIMVKRIRQKSLQIIDTCISELFDECCDESEEDEED